MVMKSRLVIQFLIGYIFILIRPKYPADMTQKMLCNQKWNNHRFGKIRLKERERESRDLLSI